MAYYFAHLNNSKAYKIKQSNTVVAIAGFEHSILCIII